MSAVEQCERHLRAVRSDPEAFEPDEVDAVRRWDEAIGALRGNVH